MRSSAISVLAAIPGKAEACVGVAETVGATFRVVGAIGADVAFANAVDAITVIAAITVDTTTGDTKLSGRTLKIDDAT